MTDALQIGPLLEQTDGSLDTVIVYGAYDQSGVHSAVAEHHPDAAAESQPTLRDRHLQTIAEHGRMSWQASSRYNDQGRQPTGINSPPRCNSVVRWPNSPPPTVCSTGCLQPTSCMATRATTVPLFAGRSRRPVLRPKSGHTPTSAGKTASLPAAIATSLRTCSDDSRTCDASQPAMRSSPPTSWPPSTSWQPWPTGYESGP